MFANTLDDQYECDHVETDWFWWTSQIEQYRPIKREAIRQKIRFDQVQNELQDKTNGNRKWMIEVDQNATETSNRVDSNGNSMEFARSPFVRHRYHRAKRIN